CGFNLPGEVPPWSGGIVRVIEVRGVGARGAGAGEGAEQGVDAGGKLDLRVVLGGIADHGARDGDAPELARVVGYSVEDLERDAVGVADIVRLDAADHQLLQVALAEVGAQVAVELQRAAAVLLPLQLARRADA